MAHVFICYNRKDYAFVDRIEGDLHQRGIETWRDIHSVPGGEVWFKSIQEGLEASRAMLYIDTPNAATSVWMGKELLYALALKLPIIPVKQDEKYLSFKTIDLNPVICDDARYESGIEHIAAVISKFPNQPIVAGARPATTETTSAHKTVTAKDVEDYIKWALVEWEADLSDSLYVNLQATAQAAPQLPKPPRKSVWDVDYDIGFNNRLALEHIKGEHFDKRGEDVPDARVPIHELHKVILLGEPGAGKTTTLLQLAVDTARTAQKDPANAKIPVFVPLRQFNGSEGFPAFVQKQMYNLQEAYPALKRDGRLILLLDALNEMPHQSAAEDKHDLVAEVRDFLNDQPDWVVSCRVRDYEEQLSKLDGVGKVRLKPLDPPQIYEVIQRRFKEQYAPQGIATVEDGEALWQTMYGSDTLLRAWSDFEAANQSDLFWTWIDWPESVPRREVALLGRLVDIARSEMLGDRRLMMPLCRNPYMTKLVCDLYASDKSLPENRGALFEKFVDALLKRDREAAQAVGAAWIDDHLIRRGLAQIGFAMGGKTEMPRAEAEEILRQTVPDADHALLLRLATGASLLDVGESVRFTHQLLQEYFASEVLGAAIDSGVDPAKYWHPDHWWEPNGREETLIILAGVRGNPEAAARWIAPAQPDLALQVLRDSGIPIDLNKLDSSTRQTLINVGRRFCASDLPYNRAAGYRWLGRLNGDDRPGLTVDDIIWCEIKAGTFLYGDDKKERRIDQPYAISKYPVTNAQYAPFIDAGGYDERRFWTEAGWEQKVLWRWTEPGVWRDPVWNISNHPVVGVSWYEAVAYTRWLTEYLRTRPIRARHALPLQDDFVIRLPTEMEWERAARGTEGWEFPWGDARDAAKCNNVELVPLIGQTSAVGIFPEGDSTCGASDMAGNVWEWCMTEFDTLSEAAEDGDTQGIFRKVINRFLQRETGFSRVLRGGAFYLSRAIARSAYRFNDYPFFRSSFIGFRLVRPPSQ